MIDSKFRYFVLLADMRTGSNLFENTIALYDDIVCYGELFNPNFIGGPKKPSLTTIDIDERDRNPAAIIEQIIHLNPTKITGFRLFPDHNKQVLEHVLADKTCAKLMLRRNPLDSFVSHQIAMKTGQWQLRDLAVRRDKKIEFNIDKFQTYLERKKINETILNWALQESGQTAFHFTYEDMARLETFNGAAKFLGTDQKLTALAATTRRQNPASLRDKVTNYDEMRAGIVELNHFENDTDPYVEPSKTSRSVAVHAGRTVPIMYFPLIFDGKDPVVDWMRELEQDDHTPQTKMKGREIHDWLSTNSDRVVFTCLENPVERAFRAFNNRIVFMNPDKNKWIRRVLVDQYHLELPNWPEGKRPRASDLKDVKYTSEQHSKNFVKFLEFIHGNLRGQTRAPVDPQWGSQHIAIVSYAQWTVPNFIIHPDHRYAIFATIQRQLGINPIKKVQQTQKRDLIALREVYSEKIEAAARSAYTEDYMKFGFQNWKPTD
jgi:LPS sulfotransferase NodH